jgi:hypothetical protein
MNMLHKIAQLWLGLHASNHFYEFCERWLNCQISVRKDIAKLLTTKIWFHQQGKTYTTVHNTWILVSSSGALHLTQHLDQPHHCKRATQRGVWASSIQCRASVPCVREEMRFKKLVPFIAIKLQFFYSTCKRSSLWTQRKEAGGHLIACAGSIHVGLSHRFKENELTTQCGWSCALKWRQKLCLIH